MKDDPDRVRALAPDQVSYWHALDPPGYIGGPRADRSGGLITFETGSVEEAERLVAADPFVRAELLESSWVKEWTVKAPDPARDLRTAATGPVGR
jgi:hypothetical protein